MSAIPARPTWITRLHLETERQFDQRFVEHEHAIAKALYEWVFHADHDDGCGILNEDDSPPCSRCELLDRIKESGWTP